ncbi:MAG: helix-turn-helix domain-containing protein [Sediminibacterium sp.]|jgi:transcriptional regulator with XRE-family HTH domain|nr:helix-turn-helix domain-containing protein [Sediminibacterium sp.]
MPQNQRVIIIRNYLNLTQKEFAIALNVAQSKISKIEMGEQSLNTEMLATIIRLYNVNADWILGLKGEDDVILFNDEFVPKVEYEKERNKNYELMEELLEYRKKQNKELELKNS